MLIRKDRMHDQKIISDLQTQNAFLNMKLSDLTEISSNSNRANNHRQNMNNNLTVINIIILEEKTKSDERIS